METVYRVIYIFTIMIITTTGSKHTARYSNDGIILTFGSPDDDEVCCSLVLVSQPKKTYHYWWRVSLHSPHHMNELSESRQLCMYYVLVLLFVIISKELKQKCRIFVHRLKQFRKEPRIHSDARDGGTFLKNIVPELGLIERLGTEGDRHQRGTSTGRVIRQHNHAFR